MLRRVHLDSKNTMLTVTTKLLVPSPKRAPMTFHCVVWADQAIPNEAALSRSMFAELVIHRPSNASGADLG